MTPPLDASVSEHWVSSSVPSARRGREAALTTQATSAGRASRRMRLFRMGRNEVRIVATSANRTDIMRLWSLPILALFDPGLSTHLHRVPWATHGRRVAEVEVGQVVDAHAMKQGGGKD